MVFQMYKKGHNQCKRRSLGTYKMDVDYFVRAYVRQLQREYESKGQEYEVDGEAMEYLKCQQYYYNNNMVRCLNADIRNPYDSCHFLSTHIEHDFFCSTS